MSRNQRRNLDETLTHGSNHAFRALEALDANMVKMDHQIGNARRICGVKGRTGVNDERMHHTSRSRVTVHTSASIGCLAGLLQLPARRVVLEQL